ncbi:LysR family transcriptional regulator [Achromobacter sp. GG226]|uniref:LysR substrate-binding domain-containing protein n=1 Tax=Verticiella alkaliphila TaxID=2779529 RepID=UPI001C0CF571|nr:LysR substrate-binding domain-containing protein [Verticiella sp. GG226]MBU4611171.1 LysR family transcriptional regulator [Verticiella sp. GG226]
MSSLRFDLTSVRLFIATVEHGSITRAAEQQCVAVTAASRRIADLEAQFGLALFDRRPHGMVLTPAGRSLLTHARGLMQAVERMHSEAAAFAHGDKGTVRVAACTSAALQFLPEDLMRHRDAHPYVDIDLHEMSSLDVVKALVQGTVDIGIHEESLAPPPGFVVHAYRHDRLVLVVPAGHALAKRAEVDFAALLPYEFVALAEGTALAALIEREAAQHGAPLRLRVRTRSFDTMLSMIRAGMGVGLVPSGVAERIAADAEFAHVPVREAWAARRFVVCHGPAQDLPRSAAALVQSLVQAPPAPDAKPGLPKQ